MYEIEGNWGEDTPNEVKTGDVVSTTWRYNINDDSAAPTNDPVDNVTLTFVSQGAVFTTLPSVCLVGGVTPDSSISADGKTMTCNLGTRDQGTAELVITGLSVQATDGEQVTVSGSVGDVTAGLPPLSVKNVFAMDLKFDGSVRSAPSSNGTYQEFWLPWSLQHGPNGPAGPASVSYNIQITDSLNQDIQLFAGQACNALDLTFSGYPRSDSAAGSDQKAAFPTCTITRSSKNNFRLTLSGLDYAQSSYPTKDGAGVDLPSEWNVIASGKISMYFPYTEPGNLTVTVNAPTYTSPVSGQASADDGSNNTHSVPYTRGSHTSGWQPQTMRPRPIGSYWNDTFRQLVGGPVRQGVGIVPTTNTTTNQVCSILDTKYVEFEGAAVGRSTSAGTILSDPDVTEWYYIGSDPSVNPSSPSYNPNSFSCETGWGSNAWVSTPPADLSQVKAVRATIGNQSGFDMSDRNLVMLYVDSKIKAGVPEGQDIWQWGSYKYGSNAWQSPHREMNSAAKPATGTLTPNSRYPFAAPQRDVMRVIVAQPTIEKQVDAAETIPGATVTYTLRYRAEGATDIAVPNYKVVDTLPAGMNFVPGSASVAPTTVSGQTLSWDFATINTNTDYVITFQATIPGDAEPGAKFVNTATSSIGTHQATADATTTIRESGLTLLTKSAEHAKVPHEDGVATDSWTVRITSADVKTQAFTDTIDVLPYNGDGRGTSFSGSYELNGPVQAVAGATVYYTNADPTTLKADPADPSNGAANDPSTNTVGWGTTFIPDATAVRVIGPALAPSAQQEFSIPVITTGATAEDLYVNVAEARAERTKLKMRTSSMFQIAAVKSVSIKKYVQDSDGNWHDAQNVDDYPTHYAGDTVPYRLVVTNTGDETLTDVQITDDRVDLAGLDPLPDGLEAGAVIPELLPGEDNAVTIEYSIVLGDEAAGGSLINNACAIPEDAGVEESCDPAGILVETSTLSWEKVNAGDVSEYLAGSEWSLVRVDENGDPVGSVIAVTDCIEDAAADCSGPDVNPEPGKFKIAELAAGDYVLTETRAPAGYVLDDTQREITVRGDTEFEVPIENTQSDVPQLPLTGGMGTFAIFLGAGSVGLLVAFALWMQRRRSRIAIS
ncbi:SpaA isopeptide-forming pilin-related protein [Leucobacter massiliensis]|nr:SpaA isopeptide-forming pilin-related protein [Leucobacter massiliensis]